MTPPLSRSDDPIPNSHLSLGQPIGLSGRIGLGLFSLFLCSGFALAASLNPDPEGLGTHRQLGLPPCSIIVLYGVPCPNCGMTTSFAHAVRGQLVSAAEANVAGLILAIGCLVIIPWCWVSVVQSRLYRVWRPWIPLSWLLGVVLVVSVIQWSVRVFVLN